jgi:hypothetical protein
MGSSSSQFFPLVVAVFHSIEDELFPRAAAREGTDNVHGDPLERDINDQEED